MNLRYFTEKQIYAATFFGGPIPAGILIYKNLKRINEDRQASLVLMITFVFNILLFYFLIRTAGTIVDEIPDMVFTSLYTLIVYLLYNNLLKDKIEKVLLNNISDGPALKESNWNVFGWTVLGLAVTLAIIFGMAYYEPAFPGEKITFGDAGHEVFYDKNEFTEHEVLMVGQMLTEFEYFSGTTKNSVRLELDNNKVSLLIPVHKDFWLDEELDYLLRILCTQLSSVLGKESTLELVHYQLNGDQEAKTIRPFESLQAN